MSNHLHQNCPYGYFESDENYSLSMCRLHPDKIWGVSKADCMACANISATSGVEEPPTGDELVDRLIERLSDVPMSVVDGARNNGDVIRSMNNYDLADWIAKILIYHGKVALNEYHVDCDKRCPLYYCCNDQPTDNIEGWLDLPVEENA